MGFFVRRSEANTEKINQLFNITNQLEVDLVKTLNQANLATDVKLEPINQRLTDLKKALLEVNDSSIYENNDNNTVNDIKFTKAEPYKEDTVINNDNLASPFNTLNAIVEELTNKMNTLYRNHEAENITRNKIKEDLK